MDILTGQVRPHGSRMETDMIQGQIYRRVTLSEFQAAMTRAVRHKRGAQALCVSAPERDADLFLSGDGLSGYALKGDYLGSVFSGTSGRLSGMIRDARSRAKRNGEWALRLDCFEPLAAIYERHGFTRTSSVAFDWAYAPVGWVEGYGTPDVVFMAVPLSEAPMAAPVSAVEYQGRIVS